MRDRDFRELVAKMRAAQKDFFRTRGPGALRAARDLERRVDDVLEHDSTGRLFGLESDDR